MKIHTYLPYDKCFICLYVQALKKGVEIEVMFGSLESLPIPPPVSNLNRDKEN